MRKIIIYLLIVILNPLVSITKLSAENTLIIHADRGTYNQGYKDLNYIDNNEATFDMGKSSFGIEYAYINSERISTGGGFSYTDIEKGREWNLNHYETHQKTMIMVPYIFTGYDFDYFGCELGISCYLQFSKHEPDLYYLADGSTITVNDSGIYLDRKKSHTFINAKIRLFKEDSLHCKFRIGRENFDAVDSLINFAVVYPFGNHRFECYLSLLTPENYLTKLFNQEYVLKSNQTTGISYMYFMGGIGFGIRAGVLIYNAHGGFGPVPVLNKVNGGIFTEVKW